MVDIPSPALAIVGRHNSGKTTLIVKLIAELVARGYDVGSVKHHSHKGFDIDIPGKDSYRHREAGASETVIAAPGQMARIKTMKEDLDCASIVSSMPNHDVVIVEGFRKSGLPTIEIMRADNPADEKTAAVFAHGARQGWPLGTDFTQVMRELRHAEEGAERDELLASLDEQAAESARMARDDSEAVNYADVSTKLVRESTVSIVSDIPEALEAARIYGIPAFGLNDVSALADFVEQRFVRPKISVVIQAGGESRRMGRSKATVPFNGKPLICRLVSRLHPAADELIITTNEPENLAFLHDEFPDIDIKLVRDAFDYRGALPGLYTALTAASHPYVAVVACDMLFASARLIVAESITMNEEDCDVVVPVNKHGYEPFHALYRKDTCLPAVKEGLARGDKRAQSFFENVHIFEFTQDMVLDAEPRGGCFINANTPEELHTLERGFGN